MNISEFAGLCYQTLGIDPFNPNFANLYRNWEDQRQEREAEGFHRQDDYEIFLKGGVLAIVKAAAKEMGIPVEKMKNLPPDTPLPNLADDMAQELQSVLDNRQKFAY